MSKLILALALGGLAHGFVPARPAPFAALRRASAPALRMTATSAEPDEVDSLLKTAAKLREEAELAEVELKTAVQLGAEQRSRDLFKVFDLNDDGTIDEGELREGLARYGGGSGPTEAQAAALVKRFDADANGVLSIDEWLAIAVDRPRDPVGSLRAALRELVRDERESAKALEAAQQEDLDEAAYAAAWAQTATLPERALAVLPFVLPLSDILPLLQPLIQAAPHPLSDALAPLANAAFAFDTLPLGTLVLFLGISAVANDATLTLFRRFHAHLAINLDIALFVPTTLVRLALFAKLLQPEQAEPLIAATGVAFLVAMLYAAGGALAGGQVGGLGGADLLGPLAARAKSSTDRIRLVPMDDETPRGGDGNDDAAR